MLISVTVKDILGLPSLKNANVIAGQPAVTKVVASVSVLEYSQITNTQAEIYQHINFNNDELVLTAFASVRDDVEAQCENIKTLAKAGELGLILFYVGLILPKVDQRLIKVADEYNFIIILMPKNEPELTYSSVITEIMFSVFNDQIENPNFSAELVEKVSSMPSYQQNLDMVLRLLSDRLRASVALVDSEDQLISSQQWPQTNSLNWKRILNNIGRQNQPDGMHVYTHGLGKSNQTLVLCKEHGELTHTTQKQAVETIRISLNLWGKVGSSNNEMAALLDAIIQNEPQKITQLANKNHIKIQSLSMLLIVSNLENIDNLNNAEADIVRITRALANIAICEIYHDEILILPVNRPSTLQEWHDWQAAISQYSDQKQLKITTTRFNDLHGDGNIREAYLNNHQYLPVAQIIFPRRTIFSGQDLLFSKSCQELIDHGGGLINSQLGLIGQLSTDMIKTLLVFLLDARGNIEEAAKLLFIHRNTAKYRLKKLNNYFGFKVGLMPDSSLIYQASAIYRIINGDPV